MGAAGLRSGAAGGSAPALRHAEAGWRAEIHGNFYGDLVIFVVNFTGFVVIYGDCGDFTEFVVIAIVIYSMI